MTAWTASGLALALAGPGLIALLWKRSTRGRTSPGASALWLAAFILLCAGVATTAIRCEHLSWADVGFRGAAWSSVPAGIGLALFFILAFGPIAAWALARFGSASFDAGREALAALPAWYLCLAVTAVAAGEEWLYRGYSIERLEFLTGNAWLAALLSLLAFSIAHLPLWGIGVSLTTLASGGLLTALYLWRRDVSFLILAHVLTDLHGLVITPRRAQNQAGARRSR